MAIIIITVTVTPHCYLLSVCPFASVTISLSLSFPLLSDGVNNSCLSFKEALCSPCGVFFKITWRSSHAHARAQQLHSTRLVSNPLTYMTHTKGDTRQRQQSRHLSKTK